MAILTQFENKSTAEEAIIAGGLNWDVVTEDVLTAAGAKLKDRLLTVRSDTGEPLGVVSNRYCVLQNNEAFKFMDNLMADKEGPKYVASGCLYGGRKVCLVADMGAMEVVAGDEIRKQIILAHAHDGSMSVTTMLTPRRIYCDNQLNSISRQASEDGALYKIRHTGDVTLKLDDVKEALGLLNKKFDETLDVYKSLARVRPTTQQIDEVLKALIPDTKREGRAVMQRERILELADVGMGNNIKGVHGTAWALYNGITELVDHYNGITSKREDKDSYRYDSATFGLGAKFKRTALETIIATCLN